MQKAISLNSRYWMIAGWLPFIICLYMALSPAMAQNVNSRPDFETDKFHIETTDGRIYQFHLEVADTSQKRTYGLMFVEEMAADEGMIFIWDKPALRHFWMRNTFVSLDILFFDKEGLLIHIAEHTTPLSERSIPSVGPTQFVVELNAGEAHRRQLDIGSQLHFGGNHKKTEN